MFLVDPPPTAADLHFRLFGFPIRVTPWFWAVSLVLALGGGDDSPEDDSPESVLTWVVVVFASILVHELGHAFAMHFFGEEARITLYHFGGLAIGGRVDRSAREQIIISLAGPVAGFLLATIVVGIIAATGHLAGFRLGLVPIEYWAYDDAAGFPFRDRLIGYLLFVNFAWGLINLLPIYPLDGGQVAREIFVELDAGRGVVRSIWLSIITAAAFAVYALVAWNTLFVPIMFGMLAYGSYQMLQAYTGRGW